jgi:hypothetical protein
MSTHIMAACWPLRMPPTPKSVLMSLADNANDQGVCWPSIATICTRTCYTERTVQGAIRWLAEKGLIEVEIRPGRSTLYRVAVAAARLTPRNSCGEQQMRSTPADAARTPAANAPDPRSSRTQNRKEQSRNRQEPPKKDRKARHELGVDDLIAEGVERQHAEDWLRVRRVRRAPLTFTAWADVKAEAAKAGITVAEAVHIAAAGSWQGFKAAWRESGGGKQVRSPRESLSEQSARLNREHDMREVHHEVSR